MAVAVIAFLLPGIGHAATDDELRAETLRNIENDDLSGEDIAIRKVAREALGTAAGTVLVMDARTGRIYTIINQEWGIKYAFKPCSTIKLVTGIAGYNESLIEPDGRLASGGYRLNLDAALAYSNNPYFQKVGSGLGSEKLIYYALQLGLGTPTGINAEGETEGRLPYGNENPRIYSHADDFEVSPLQLGVMVSAITNGGRLLVPHIPRTRSERARFRGQYRSMLSLKPSVYKRVIPGMIGAAEYGTARSVPDDLGVAGKTGSCISKGTWVGLFASVAPVYDPKYAVVVITRGTRARGKYSAAIAGRIYQSLMNFSDRRSGETLIASSPKKAENPSSREPRPTVKRTASTKRAELPARVSPPENGGGKSVEELFPTIVIVNGKREVTRPRVISNRP